MQAPMSGPIAFLLNTYPKLSETFIAGEVVGLERFGVSIFVYSLNKPSDRVFHASTEAARAPVRYALPVSRAHTWLLVKTNLKLFLQSPTRYMRTLGFALRHRDSGWFRQFLQAASLVGSLRKDGVVHVHAHFISAPAGVAELIGGLTGLSFSVSAHAKDVYLSSPRSLRRKLSNARFTVTCTEYNRRFLEAAAGSGARVFRMYHGIDVDRFDPDAASGLTATNGSAPVILSVGRLREKKGFPTLIEACHRLRDAGRDVRCRIVGYGPDRDRLIDSINALGLSQVVELVGKLTHDDLIELYRGATVFALPCQVAADGDRDGIPNVLLEAMAMRLPVVSTAISGIPEVIEDGVNGLLVPPRDAAALSRAIETLLLNPDERRRIGIVGRETVRNMFSHARNLRRLHGLLRSAARPDVDGVGAHIAEERLYD